MRITSSQARGQTAGQYHGDCDLTEKALESHGAFTSVGNYPCSELMKIVHGLSAHSGISAEALQRKFGFWMLDHFHAKFPNFFEEKTSSFQFLEAIDGEIHVEVRKLYPDAELPRFDTRRLSHDRLEIVYSSPRPLVEFCHGLIEASIEHFGDKAQIERKGEEDAGKSACFTINRAA